jgi:hypothetical protein
MPLHTNSSASFLSDNNDKAATDFILERRDTAFNVKKKKKKKE